MSTKQAIVAELGGEQILAPDRIARALVANDQIKYYFALLQTARDNADRPRVPALDLKSERLACRLTDNWLDDVVAGTRGDRKGGYLVPHGPEILRRINIGIETMLSPLGDDAAGSLIARLSKLTKPGASQGAISGAEISAMTSGDRKAGDSLHLIVMDAHKAINRLQAETAVETIDGAHAHHLSDQGRRRVAAFMRGLNRTAPLKFDHPGLATTATEYEDQLLIQNDIGTTDAHVLVVRVHGLEASVTYTDIHQARLTFFQSLFSNSRVAWSTAEQKRSDKLTSADYILTTGKLEGRTETEVEEFLAYLGSRIVFLIDWNKARKRLQAFVAKKTAIEVLTWAADNDFGHRALLEIGGEQALGEAVEYAAGSQLRYGQRLDGLINEEAAAAFLKDAMRLAAVGLRQRRSRRNILDEIKARLAGSFESERLGIFKLAGDHAAIGYDLAFGLVEVLSRCGGAAGADVCRRLAVRASGWEARADLILNEARDDIRRFARPRALREFMEYADDAIDELEEAAAILELAELTSPSSAALDRVRGLAELALASAQELVKCIACAATITRSDIRDDLDEFIDALERLIAIEHQADTALRDIRRWLVVANPEQRQILVLRELAQALEAATDAHAHAGQELRTYLMEEVIA